MLKISRAVIEAIIQHAKKERPCEACGYLARKNEEIVTHYPLTNMDRAADHFTMDPKEQFTAIKDMRAQGLTLAAVYHSHPDTPARPSAEDIRLAYDPDISYVIISLAKKKYSLKSFLIRKGEITNEEIEIIEP